MKRVVLLSLCIVFLVLDNVLAPFFSIKSIYPSLLYTFIIVYSIVSGYWEAVIIGVVSGILQDAYFMYGFGFNSLFNLLTCLIAAYVGESIFKQKRLIPVLTVGVLTMVKYLGIFLLGTILKLEISFQGFWIMGLYNMIIAFFMYGWVYKLSNRDFMKRQWKFSEK